MPKIPESEIERVKRETDLVALIQSRGVALKQQGTNWTGLCPFHEDQNTPNLIVTPRKGLFRCMAADCGRTGNAIQFVEWHDGVSFRHAFELLAEGGKAAFTQINGHAKKTTVPKLPCPLDPEADEATLLEQVVVFYADRLRQSQPALDYLASRGLDDGELIKKYEIGFSDRSLGLRLPFRNRATGKQLRDKLVKAGVYRESGHEHLTGRVVIPIRDPQSGRIVQLYGRRIDPRAQKETRHLCLPRPQTGIFNAEALKQREIILCESIIDALTFIRHGMDAATCVFSTTNLSEQLFEAIKEAKIESVRLAFDADKSGEAATQKAAERLQSIGVECWQCKLPWGSDANSYALDQGPQALKQALRDAQWLGAGSPGNIGSTNSSSSFLAAKEAATPAANGAAKKKKATDVKSAKAPAAQITRKGEHHELRLGDRVYRVGGLEKNHSLEVMKITLRVMIENGFFHIDALDLYRDIERRKFIERAAEETQLEKELLKRDLGKLLLCLEQLQEERLNAPLEAAAATVELSPEEEAEALKFAKSPGLFNKIADALKTCGLVGERNNGMAIYLAGTSRLLPRPLAVMIQSTSAAGKTTLMEAVLDLFPAEEKVKYSAMTGQSLYYMAEQSLKNKILAVVEEEGAEKAGYALKLLQSEQELRIASTGKDPQSGRMQTEEYHVEGPAAIVLTTTSVDIDEELMNRCLVLSVDESREQTERIQTAQREAETPEGIVAAGDGDAVLARLQNFQRLLKPMKVANPFATQLTFTAERTRTRRDNMKYLGLIKAVALLHQFQREPITLKNASGNDVRMLPVTVKDIEAANRIAPEILGRSLDELPPQTRRLLEKVKTMVREKMKTKDIEQNLCHFSRREVRERVGWGATQTRIHLERLADLEYIVARHGRNGRAYQYELLIDANESEQTAHIGLLDPGKLSQIHNYSGNLTGKTDT